MIVIDQRMYAIDLNMNKLNVTLIWQRQASDWQEYTAGTASAKADLACCCFMLIDFLAAQRCHSNLSSVIYLPFWFSLPPKQH